MLHPGSYFGVFEFATVKSGVDVGSEVGPEDGEGFSIKPAFADGFHEEVHLKLRVEPARLEVRPRASAKVGHADCIGVGLGKPHGRSIELFVVKPSFNAV